MGREIRNLVEANDVRVSQHFHDLHLPEDLLQIVVIQLRLVHDFNRHLRHGERQRKRECTDYIKFNSPNTTNLQDRLKSTCACSPVVF